ncbi:DUF4843 domain-containing protein [Aestuariibaculum marinum]|uniref:DUF4843 domain-containing protein n=1 Tax=Aestuariibaculum marinum TaxID=2683592 RepID=A0A8J6PVG2_9FLAO|nr:DUF4843 domain-containing protein [Aestuariibaculum marinum]MBD0824899.1 DUF4843 domain-containing protein [Aestuariibaculum marinum]
MRKILKNIAVAFLLALTIVSCGKHDIMTFEGNDAIYYKWAVEGVNPQFSDPNYRDSLNITFAFEQPDVNELLIEIPIKVQGYPEAFAREVSVSVMDISTAIEGTHFSLPAKIVIPKDSVVGTVPVSLYRTADMKYEMYSINLKLNENENFTNNILENTMHSNVERLVSYTEFQLIVSDILTQPQYWDDRYLGPYSDKKLYLWAEVLNIPVPNWNTERPDPYTFTAQLSVFKQYLIIQEQRGTPVLEEDGEPMVLGPRAAIY